MASSKAEILRASREHDRRKRRIARFVGFLASFLIVSSFLLVVNLSFLRVTDLAIVGETRTDKTAITQFVEAQLAGRYLYLVPKNSIFFVYKKILIGKLMGNFPGLAKVTITWPNLNTLSILVVDREAKILWCFNSTGIKDCYYLAPSGVIYQSAPNFSESLYIELYSKVPFSKLGDRVIDSKHLLRSTAFLNFVKSSLSLWPITDLRLLKAEVYAQNDFVATLVKASDPAWRGLILFNTDQPANNLITNYNSILKNDKFVEDWQASSGRLEYLDLRFPSKVFYRFR
ncbi:MAG TPA: hypothetical protein P5274_00480 [Candidatus Paceibacterota bacterium]|nr:hypothetical protein [Candidatus Paceibacterota bacterium]